MTVPKSISKFCSGLAQSIINEADVEKLGTIRKQKKFCSDVSKSLTRIMNALYSELGKFTVDVNLVVLNKKKCFRIELKLV